MQIIVPRKTLDVVLTCDPAISEADTASRSAIIVAGITPLSKIIVRETWSARQGDPHALIEQILEMAYRWQPRIIGIEAVAYQQALLPWMERVMAMRHVWYVVVPLHPDRNEKKDQRIQSLQPYARAGQLYVQHGMLELIEEYEFFPKGKTKDLLDALAYAVRLLIPQTSTGTDIGLDYRLRELARRDASSAHYWRKIAERDGRIEKEPDLDDLIDWEDERMPVGVGELV